MSSTIGGSKSGLSRFAVASARSRARRCSGDSGQFGLSRWRQLSCGGGSVVVALRRLHQFRARLVVDRRLRSWAERKDAGDIATSAARWRSCRCRRSASSCSRKQQARQRQAARQASSRAHAVSAHAQQSHCKTASRISPASSRARRNALMHRKSGDNVAVGMSLLLPQATRSRATTRPNRRRPALHRCRLIRRARAPAVRAAPRRRGPKHPEIPDREPTSCGVAPGARAFRQPRPRPSRRPPPRPARRRARRRRPALRRCDMTDLAGDGDLGHVDAVDRRAQVRHRSI